MSAGPERVPVRADLVDVVPYGAPQLDVPVRLNTNETPEPPPVAFLDELARRLGGLSLNRYPDRDATELRDALARRIGRSRDEVWVANGSNEVLLQLLLAYGGPGRRALITRPGYSMYPELARTTSTGTVEVALDDAFELTVDRARQAVDEHDPDVIMVASPNNPVGTLVSHEAVRALHDGSRALVVVDEAYVDFAPEGSSVIDLLDVCPRLVVSRTFSKAFRLAGLRLGWLVAAPWVVEDLQRVRLPYHLDALTQLAGTIALELEQRFLDHRASIASERERVLARLGARGDLSVAPSVANFVLLRSDRDDLFARLLEQGVLVRDVSGGSGLAGCLRVTIGTPAENDRFLSALEQALDVPVADATADPTTDPTSGPTAETTAARPATPTTGSTRSPAR